MEETWLVEPSIGTRGGVVANVPGAAAGAHGLSYTGTAKVFDLIAIG